MSDEPVTDEGGESAPPEAIIQKQKTISVVWVIPLVAALIGAWLAARAVHERGPVITITFKTAEGLEAGKTKIRYKDVEVGQVEAIRLSDDLAHVIVTAEMTKDAGRFLTETTRFWVVRARLAAGEVSGLGTLFSGAYVGLDPGAGGESTRQFKGLDTPPAVTTDLPGRHFQLQADRLGSLDVGAPVYFRRIKVGQVVSYRLEPDGKAVSIRVFIASPHHRHVRKNSRFYYAGGIDVEVGVEGIRFNSESLVSILLGGLAFETPTNLEPGGEAEAETLFQLYPTQDSIYEQIYLRKRYYVLYFDETVRGLVPGAPVEFRGIRIGKVLDVKLEFDTRKLALRIPVLIEVEPDRVAINGQPAADEQEIMGRLVEKGLRAQLKTGNILTGKLTVNLDFFANAEPASIQYGERYPVLPTVPTAISEITASVTHLMEKIETLPMEEIGEKLRSAADGVDRLVNSGELQKAARTLEGTLDTARELFQNMNEKIGPEVGVTLTQIQKTLEEMEGLLRSDSPLQQELTRAAGEMSEAARAVRNLADYLERHPEALIRGKDGSGL